jgi:hypothetical protein
MCRAVIVDLSMRQSIFILCDGVFETMKDCKRTLASPRRCSISLMVWWNWTFGSVGAKVANALRVHKDHMLLRADEQP